MAPFQIVFIQVIILAFFSSLLDCLMSLLTWRCCIFRDLTPSVSKGMKYSPYEAAWLQCHLIMSHDERKNNPKAFREHCCISLFKESMQNKKFHKLRTEVFVTAVQWKSQAGLKFWNPTADRYSPLIQLMPEGPWPLSTNPGCSTPVPISSASFPSYSSSAEGQTSLPTILWKRITQLHIFLPHWTAGVKPRSSHTASVPARLDTSSGNSFAERLLTPEVS